MAVYPLQPSLQTVDPLQRLYSPKPHRDRQIVEALQLYSTLQHSTALQLYSALQYTSSTIPLRCMHSGAKIALEKRVVSLARLAPVPSPVLGR